MNYFLLTLSLIFIFISLRNIYFGRLYYILLFLNSIYMFFMSLIFLDIINYDAENFWATNRNFNSSTLFFYNISILFFYYISIFVCEMIVGRYRYKFGYNELHGYFLKNIVYIRFLSFFIFIFFAVHLYYLSWAALWSSREYLYINSIDALNEINPISVLVQMTSSLVAMLAAIILGISLVFRDSKSLFFILIPSIFYILLKTGEHSRLSVVYLLALSFIFMFFGNKFYRYIVAPFFLFFSGLNLINSLAGRGSGNHGLSALSDYFSNISNSFINGNGLIYAIGNLFQGTYVHAESLGYLDSDYPLIFKLLSFSPFPSFLDGFAEDAQVYSLRLNVFVPMGATGELLIFGIKYIIIYFFIVFIAIYRSIKDLKSGNKLIFVFCLFFIILATFLQYTYPLRNIVRFYYIAIFISIFFSMLKLRSIKSSD